MAHKLFFDITELSIFDKGTGIQRVTKALLRTLLHEPPTDWEVIAVRGDTASDKYLRASVYENSLDAKSQIEVIDSAIEPNEGDIFLSVDLTYNISVSLRAELVRFRNNGVGIYFVIYDLIPILYPDWFIGNNKWFEGNDYLELFNHWFESAVEEADGLICISESVESDVKSWLFKHPPLRNGLPILGHFHLGSDIGASIPTMGLPDNSSVVISNIQSSTSFLMVGTLEPRKGHELALNAFELLWASGVKANLIIVGRQGWRVESLVQRITVHDQLDNQLFWLSDISDEYLRAIYKSSSVLLALSLAEGFGLPLVEAAYFNMSIIANDIPVFREICGDGAVYFDGTNAKELSRIIQNWLDGVNVGTNPKTKTIQTLTWEASTKQLMTVLGKMSGNSFTWIS